MRRRGFLQLLGLGCGCGCGSWASARLLDYGLSAQEIAPRTWAVIGSTDYFSMDNGGNIVNVAFVEVPDGVVVIDTGPSRRYGEALQHLIERTVPGKPVLRVFNTHHHPDHIFGNQVFDPALLAAPSKVIDGIRQEGPGFADNLYRLLGDWMRGTRVVAPTLIIDRVQEDIGGRSFSYHVLSGHTACDFVIRDDETGVLFSGDLAFMFRAPTTPHAQLDDWRRSISTLQGIDRELLLPGHGAPDPDGLALEQTADYLDWLEGSLRDSVAMGLTMNEAMSQPLPQRFQALGAARGEFERSVVHLYAALQDELYRPVGTTRH